MPVALRELATVGEGRLERRPDQIPRRLPPPRLDVAVPELDLVAASHVSAADQPPQHERDGQVEPDEHVRPLRDEVAEHAVVRGVRHPAVFFGRGEDALAENVRPARLPVRPVMERVDLDVPEAGAPRKLRRERRLPAPAGARDRDAHQRLNSPRATTTAEPPTSTRSTAPSPPSARA